MQILLLLENGQQKHTVAVFWQAVYTLIKTDLQNLLCLHLYFSKYLGQIQFYNY